MSQDGSPLISEISWSRFYLVITLKNWNGQPIGLRNKTGLSHFFYAANDELPHNLRINVANVEGRCLLESDTWEFFDPDSGNIVEVSDSVLKHLESLAKPFYYTKFQQLYSVRFEATDFNGISSAVLIVDHYRKDPNPTQKKSLVAFAKSGLNVYYKVASRLRKRRGNRILFMTENNSEISGNLKAVYDRMIERGIDQDFAIERSARNIFDGRKVSLVSWFRALNTIARSDYIFVDDYVPIFAAIDLVKDTKLIQVWHAGFGFKAVGFGRFGIEGSPNPFASCHRKYTYALVGNAALRDIYAEVFGIEKEALLATGMPRLDHFLDDSTITSNKEAFCAAHPELKGKRIILFAPTYRGSDQKSAHYDYSKIDFDALYKNCKEANSAVVFKMHRFISDPVPIPPEYTDLLIDDSKVAIERAFYSADVLVTDYSSCFYDFLLLGRPVVFYCYDEALYSATRGVHLTVSDVAPGAVCHSFTELCDSLFVKEMQVPNPKSFLLDKHFAQPDYSSSDAVIDAVLFDKRDADVCFEG